MIYILEDNEDRVRQFREAAAAIACPFFKPESLRPILTPPAS